MDAIQRSVTTLIKSAITGDKYILPDHFSLEQVYPILKKHSILPMGYIGAVNCGLDKHDPLMQKMFQIYCKNLICSESQLNHISDIYCAFDKNKIDYMPVKGCNMKYLYPAPELRTMGDADILIRTEQYPQIKVVLQDLCFRESYQSDHELAWDIKGLHLELHKRLIPSCNEDFYQYYGDGWDFAKIRKGTHYYMTDEDQFVYLFTHFTKHYRDGGIGCRHVADLWVYQRNHPDMNSDYIEEELKKLNLYMFYKNVQKTICA